MKAPVEVLLYGSLRRETRVRTDGPVFLELQGPMPVRGALVTMGIPYRHVQLVMVNHQAASVDSVVRPGDRLALFPREYPIFADWKDHRLP